MQGEKDRDWKRMNHGLVRQEIIQQVTDELLVVLQERNMAVLDARQQLKLRSKSSLYRLIDGTEQNLVLAQDLVLQYPEIGQAIGEPIVCQHCGRLPHFSRRS